jgi:hypothetical protein
MIEFPYESSPTRHGGDDAAIRVFIEQTPAFKLTPHKKTSNHCAIPLEISGGAQHKAFIPQMDLNPHGTMVTRPQHNVITGARGP